ncbi:MAG: putative glutathione S-transferase, partial [bacterium]
ELYRSIFKRKNRKLNIRRVMGLLVHGEWKDQWYDTKATKGAFVRQESKFRNWITKLGAESHDYPCNKIYPAEAGRYHLYVSLACPWAHRTLIFRKLKKLEDLISVSVVDPLMFGNGWEFSDHEGCTSDELYHLKYLWELYKKADEHYVGRVTVPILWDKKTETIVNNESSEIIRIFNSEFNDLTGNQTDFYPEELRMHIDEMNEFVYHSINNGVYRCGFATTQEAYENAYEELFEYLDVLDELLQHKRYLMGDVLTEADWRLFTTLVRFDSVYYSHFKCSKKKLIEYSNLWNYVKELAQIEGILDTINMDHIKQHYYRSHTSINPTGIVPVGPNVRFTWPHNREK